MRILHIISTLNPEAGGPSESVRTLMAFNRMGYSGEVVTLDDPAAPFLRQLDFPVHALGPVSTVFAYSSRLMPWLKANQHRFDGVIVNGLWNFCGIAAWRVLRGETPYMVFPHGMLDPWFKHQYPLKHVKKWIYWVLAQYWILRRSYRVLFTTREEGELARKSFWLHRWSGFVVPYGCSRPPEDTARLRQTFLEQVPTVRGQRFLLFLGRIHRKKGCDLLIRSFIRCAALDPGLHLVMAGPDQQNWAAELKEIVANAELSNRVHWPGMLKGEAKWGALYACEVFILPSHQENFGIAVAEALACGKAVLLADQVNIAPQIAEDGAGLLEFDTQAGTDALVERWIAMAEAQRATMQAQALATFRKRYDMEANAATIIRLFDGAHQHDQRPSA